MQPADHPATTAAPLPRWTRELAEAVTSPTELLSLLDLAAEQLDLETRRALETFPMRVPLHFVARMRKGDPTDPLLLQVLASAAEDLAVPGYRSDPVGDLASLRCDGLLQKYHGRALLITTGACALHCRYCFRRSFPYPDQALHGHRLAAAMDEIAGDPSLTEIILSGGDPLTLSDRRLADILARLDDIAHVRRVRIHTRTPIAVPRRVTRELLTALKSVRARLVIVVHVNHAAEIDADVGAAMEALAEPSCQLLNQSVLLRRINDSARALCMLSEALHEHAVLPYYLHQLDPVQGAAHFAVDDTTAIRLLREVSARLPGYLVPRLVREVHGEPAKQPLEIAP